MFRFIGKGIAKGAIKEAESRAVEISGKVLDILKAPPQHALELWNGLSPEDKALFREAGLSAARLTAKVIIAADKGGKTSF